MRAEILAAAGALLLEEEMAAFTIERVAARAGASKTTIYKWWPSKGALALDGYFHAVEATLAFPTPATSSATSPPSCAPSSASSVGRRPGG